MMLTKRDYSLSREWAPFVTGMMLLAVKASVIWVIVNVSVCEAVDHLYYFYLEEIFSKNRKCFYSTLHSQFPTTPQIT